MNKENLRLRDSGGFDQTLLAALTSNCSRCQGLCCIALYRARADGFPADLPAGTPCPNLLADSRCAVHHELKERKLRGCIAYDCLGAGQSACARSENTDGWRDKPHERARLFSLFSMLYTLHLVLWMLADAASLLPACTRTEDIIRLIAENTALRGKPDLKQEHIFTHKLSANELLRDVAALTQTATGGKKHFHDCVGRDLRGTNLRGADFSMALLIGARLDGCVLDGCNFLGADLRDTNLCGADLRESVFLTPMQLASARGNQKTLLAPHLARPAGWKQAKEPEE